MTQHATGPDGNRVAFDITDGDGPDLILLHGITERRTAWEPLREGLSDVGRVVAVDLRGHGESEKGDGYGLDQLAADVKAVADQVGAGEPVVIGHSLGGFVASVYAAAYPTRAAVNIDQPLALAAFKQQLSAVEDMLRGDAFEAVIGQIFEPMMAGLPPAEHERVGALRRPDQEVVLGVWDPVFSQSVAELDSLTRSLLSGLEAPYLAIHGDDPGDEYRAWLAGVIPQAELEVWEGDAHYPHLCEPDRFVQRVRDHVT